MFTVDGFFYNAWFSDGLSLKHRLIVLIKQLFSLNTILLSWEYSLRYIKSILDAVLKVYHLDVTFKCLRGPQLHT